MDPEGDGDGDAEPGGGETPCRGGAVVQPAASSVAASHNARTMWLFVVEALIALGLLIFLVWWTMFHGRRRGEPVEPPPADTPPRLPAAPEPPARRDDERPSP